MSYNYVKSCSYIAYNETFKTREFRRVLRKLVREAVRETSFGALELGVLHELEKRIAEELVP